MPKIVKYALSMIFCFTVLIVAVYASNGRVASAPIWQETMYEVESLNLRQQGLDIRGEVPVILEEFGASYENLNQEIENAVNTLAEGTRRIRARHVTFRYEIESTNEVVSIVIYATARAVTDRTTVLSVNFNPRNGNLVTLTQAARNRDITPLVEGKIAEMIRQDPATYYAAFTAPATGQAFYVTNTELVLLFDEFQLSSVPGATSEIRFVLDSIREYTIRNDEYRISNDRYAIRMIPVRRVLEGLGYGVRWEQSEGEAIITLNGQAVIILRPGENNYQLNGVLQRSLETAPLLTGGNMYVPISFFDQILGLTAFTVDSRGDITFITYLGRA
ncbi:MAG: copper amine oxidase N-terminal domain-containing protein [Defluviitaleaceae bacterium]|nr:copper amine oxidase N-terminal domain-containing protein [Defluviitaleaceae bacterium]